MRYRAVFLTSLLVAALCAPAWAEDCGARGREETRVVVFNCKADGEFSPLMIRVANNKLRGLNLVELNDPHRTTFRVRYTDAGGTQYIKAIGDNDTVALSTCEKLQLIGYHPNYSSTTAYEFPTDIDCRCTNPANVNDSTDDIKCSDQIWQKGYSARFPGGLDELPLCFRCVCVCCACCVITWC